MRVASGAQDRVQRAGTAQSRGAGRGPGGGTALLARRARVAVERDCGRLEWSVLDWNEPAIGFYKKLGAKPMDEWTIFRVTGDALKTLASS